ncbi:hypothetical protein G7046_g4410 [Stylonectria norvegica]|nr:hypothetical protein G7046_g4410 [Stylonectria norvegica]
MSSTQESADKAAVVDALYRFAVGIDEGNQVLLASALAEDSVSDFRLAAAKAGFDYPVIEGKEAIVSALSASLATIYTTHSVANPRVMLDGDKAHLEALVEAQHVPRSDPSRHYLMKNRYNVDLARVLSEENYKGSHHDVYGFGCVNVNTIGFVIRSIHMRKQTFCYAYSKIDCKGSSIYFARDVPDLDKHLTTHSVHCFDNSIESRAVSDSYTFYTGNGSGGSGWPTLAKWGTFDELWNTNQNILQNSCVWNNYGANNSPQEIADIRTAILQVSSEAQVGPRFMLAIVLQESKGCVRAPTRNNGVVNPGLMQSHNGSGSCAGVNPCPFNSILQMIRDGTAGTSSGDGLKQTLAKTAPTTGSGSERNYFAAARMYNSGSVDYNNLNNGLGSTPCYSTDVANRLTGWTLAASQCRA